MSANLAAAVLSLLAAAMLTAAAAACSDDSPDPDAAAQSDAAAAQDAKGPDAAASADAGPPQSNASDPADQAAPAQAEAVDILQSDNRFINIALSRYRSSVSDIDPDALNPWCTHPDAENIVVPPRQRTSPPVPEYLPEGVSFLHRVSPPDLRSRDTYVSGDGNGDHIRLRVLYSTCLITNSDPALIERVDVGGNWGVFVTGLKGAGSFDLHFETDLGVVTIQRVITGGEEAVSKDELVRIAESMPVFDGEAAYRIHRLDASSSADDAQPETGFIISPLGFVKVGIGESVDDVYPPGLHERCISPGPGYPPPISQESVSPPVPAYLPAGVSLERKSYAPSGAYIGDIYVGSAGERITVRSGACGAVFAPPGLWEPISVAGVWGVLVQGACVVAGDSGIYSVEDALPDCWKPNAALNLTMETESGFVEIRSVNVGVNQNNIGKDEIVKIAESMPVFDGEAVSARP